MYGCMYTRGMNNTLTLAWNAYTRPDFDTIYDAHAARIGHRPVFRVRHGGDTALVTTTDTDLPHVRALITELEGN